MELKVETSAGDNHKVSAHPLYLPSHLVMTIVFFRRVSATPRRMNNCGRLELATMAASAD